MIHMPNTKRAGNVLRYKNKEKYKNDFSCLLDNNFTIETCMLVPTIINFKFQKFIYVDNNSTNFTSQAKLFFLQH